MARTKQTKEKRRRTTEETRDFDAHRFSSALHSDRFGVIQANKKYLTERKVDLRPGQYEDIRGEIVSRGWERLVSYPQPFNITLVQEFYANAFQFEDVEQPLFSYVRGSRIPYDAEAINNFLGLRFTLDDQCYYRRTLANGLHMENLEQMLCLPGKHFNRNRANAPLNVKRKNLNKRAQAWMTIVLCNWLPSSHTSDIEMKRATLIYTIMQGLTVNIGKIISDEIRHISTTTDKTPLSYPSLITELCRHGGVDPDVVRGARVILRAPITKKYIDRYCIEPGQAPADDEPEDAEEAGPSRSGSAAITREEFMHMSRRQDQMADDIQEILELLRNRSLAPVEPRDEASPSEEEEDA